MITRRSLTASIVGATTLSVMMLLAGTGPGLPRIAHLSVAVAHADACNPYGDTGPDNQCPTTDPAAASTYATDTTDTDAATMDGSGEDASADSGDPTAAGPDAAMSADAAGLRACLDRFSGSFGLASNTAYHLQGYIHNSCGVAVKPLSITVVVQGTCFGQTHTTGYKAQFNSGLTKDETGHWDIPPRETSCMECIDGKARYGPTTFDFSLKASDWSGNRFVSSVLKLGGTIPGGPSPKDPPC